MEEIERELSKPCPVCIPFQPGLFCLWCGNTYLHNQTQFAGRSYDANECHDLAFFTAKHADARNKWLKAQLKEWKWLEKKGREIEEEILKTR